MMPRHFAQGHIDRLNGVGRVDPLTALFGRTEQRDNPRPMSVPRFADDRILVIPLLGKQLQIELCFCLGCRRINRFQVLCSLCSLLVSDIFQRIAHQMDQAQLDLGLRKRQYTEKCGKWKRLVS